MSHKTTAMNHNTNNSTNSQCNFTTFSYQHLCHHSTHFTKKSMPTCISANVFGIINPFCVQYFETESSKMCV